MDEDFALNIRLLTALAFVPVEHVIKAFDELMNVEFYSEIGSNEHNKKIDDLVTYFQRTYVFGFDRSGKRKDHSFPQTYGMCMKIHLCVRYYDIRKWIKI